MSKKDSLYQELLVSRCRRGDREAFEDLVRLWEMRLFYFIRRLFHAKRALRAVLEGEVS